MSPIIDDGWFMATESRLMVSYMDHRVTPESYARHLRALARDIDEWRGDNRAVLYDTPTPFAMTAEQRKQLADLLEARKQRLRSITAGYVMITPSSIARGILTAVFWIAPPPYEHRVVGTPEEAFAWLAQQCSWLEPASGLAQYARLKRDLLARMNGQGARAGA